MAEIDAPNLQSEAPRETPLGALHRARGGRMVPFAGWTLPLHYAGGIIAEHRQCREKAALFDVSHMAQLSLPPHEAAALEKAIPADIAGLAPGRQRYAVLPNEVGGLVDDLMVARWPDRIGLVVNASRAMADRAHLASHLPGDIKVHVHEDRALLALQGPAAEGVMARLAPDAAAMRFMDALETELTGVPAWITRSGYTGEDGFEISVPGDRAEAVAEALLADPDVEPAGLGARDSLRLEAGLALYGQDIDELTSPVEASLAWTFGKRRREACDFVGGVVIGDHLRHGPHRKLVGLLLEGRVPARAGALLADEHGGSAGAVTSGCFSPTLERPIAMGYVRRDLAEPGTRLRARVRERDLPAVVVATPFVPHRYKK